MNPSTKMKTPLSTRKYKKSEETINKILDGAVNLFYEHGFTKASTRQLVKEAGMSSSAIYNHFANKEAILFTIIQRASNKVLHLLNHIEKEYDEPDECLKQMIFQMLGLFNDELMKKEIAIFIDELYQLPPDLRDICNRQHKKVYNIFKNKVIQIKRKNRKTKPGSFQANNTVATFVVVGAMLWVYHWYKDSGSLRLEKISDQLINILFNGLNNAT